MSSEETPRYLDTQGFTSMGGEFISLRDASQIGVTEIAGRHHLQVYSTADHQMHILQGDSFATSEDAQDRVDSHTRGMKSVVFENNAAPSSTGEVERWEKRKAEIAEEKAAPGFGKDTSGSIYLEY